MYTPIKHSATGEVLEPDNRTYNALLRSLRCLSEHGFALLTGRWRAFLHITASPRTISANAVAALVLIDFEHDDLPAEKTSLICTFP